MSRSGRVVTKPAKYTEGGGYQVVTTGQQEETKQTQQYIVRLPSKGGEETFLLPDSPDTVQLGEIELEPGLPSKQELEPRPDTVRLDFYALLISSALACCTDSRAGHGAGGAGGGAGGTGHRVRRDDAGGAARPHSVGRADTGAVV